MKKILSLAALGLCAVFTSCSDFLDQDSPSVQSKENVFNSTFFTGLEINKIYGGLGQDNMYSNRLSISFPTNSDIELIDGLGSTIDTNLGTERGYMNYDGTPSGWSYIGSTWTNIYGCIEYCNLAVDGIRNSDIASETAMKQYLGEALTLRALLYLELVRLWGDVPFMTSPTNPSLEDAYAGKTDRDVILDALLADLEEAIPLLPWAGSGDYTTERITRGYANALCAQIALTRAGYAIREKAKDGYETEPNFSDPTYPTQRPDAQTRKGLYEKALTCLSEIITNGTHSMNPDFREEWKKVNSRTLDLAYKENIFEVPLLLNISSELGYTIGKRINGATTEFGAKGNSSNKQRTTASFLYSFEKSDSVRRDVTCCLTSYKEGDNGTIEQMATVGPFAINIGKWRPEWMGEEWRTAARASSDKVTTGVNAVKMRYSQVLLLYAEVMNELAGPTGNYTGDAGLTALQALAMVHNRAVKKNNNDTSTDTDNFLRRAATHGYADFFEDIVQESAWELCGEAIRKWDLIRWGILATKIAEAKADYDQNCLSWPTKIYFNYTDDTKSRIDERSITWYGLDETGKLATDYDGSATGPGFESLEKKEASTQWSENLPRISEGLVGLSIDGTPSVPAHGIKNRYIMPIYVTTIADSRGSLENSYGF